MVERAIEADLGRPVDAMFLWIDPQPLGSAWIAQTHRAVTREGDSAVLKLVRNPRSSPARRRS